MVCWECISPVLDTSAIEILKGRLALQESGEMLSARVHSGLESENVRIATIKSPRPGQSWMF